MLLLKENLLLRFMENFQPGDIVVLRSGSPTMTVKEITDNNVTVTWWQDGKIQEATLPAAALEKYVPPSFSPRSGGGNRRVF